MEPLEQITILMTLMRRLEQVMDQERGILKGMRLDTLPDLQDEKEALAEAYEIEFRRLREQPERLAELEPHVREELEVQMRSFQARLARNLDALRATHRVVEKVLKTIGDSLQRQPGGPGYGTGGQPVGGMSGARVIPMTLDRQL